MKEEKLKTDELRQFARYIQIDYHSWNKIFEKHVHPSAETWKIIFKYMLIVLGIGFFVSGVFFFFAYNWDALHKFTKLFIVQSLMLISIVFAIQLRKKTIVSGILLTASSLFTGAMFAVFGQVYQTGANAFDFFLGWTVFISLWTLAVRFEFLYILFFILIHLCIRFYTEQLAFYWSDFTELFYHLLVSVFYYMFFSISRIRFSWKNWFLQLLTIFTFIMATYSVSIIIHSRFHMLSVGIIFLYLLILTYSFYIAIHKKSIFYLSVIALSVIIAGASLLLKISSDSSMFLLICIYIVGSITATIMKLLSLQKIWKHE